MHLPLPDTERVVEVKISPADIGFVQLEQSARIKFDAYDDAIFGSLQCGKSTGYPLFCSTPQERKNDS